MGESIKFPRAPSLGGIHQEVRFMESRADFGGDLLPLLEAERELHGREFR